MDTIVFSHKAYAAQITNRSLTLEAGAGGDGGSKPGGTVNHFFQFTIPPSASTVGSIKFEYCTTASVTACALPGNAGNGNVVNTTAATLSTETGASGFTLVNTTNGAPYLTRPAASVGDGTNPTPVTYRLAGVVNPKDNTNPNLTFFVRISTYSTTDATGTPIDTGTVAASTATQIQLTGTMPESLIFCTGATISTTNSVPDCTTATPGAVTFNQLFSPTDTSTATSQMAASTNAGTGYVITLNGPTLTSGSNTIPDMSTADNSKHSVGQFGLNLVNNTGTMPAAPATPGPAVGAAIAPASNGTNYKANPKVGYDTDGTFKFIAGSDNVVAASDNGGAGPTDAQIYTASYIVNVTGSQPAGTYTTTLTYTCTPTF